MPPLPFALLFLIYWPTISSFFLIFISINTCQNKQKKKKKNNNNNKKIELYVISQNINSETKTNPNILLISKLKQIQKGGNSLQIKPKKKNPSLFLIKDLKTQQFVPTYSNMSLPTHHRVQLYPYGL